MQHNNNKQTNKQTTKTHKNCIKHCNNHTNNQHPMSITTSKPKLLTAICNCCCTQNHQPLPFLLLPSLRENITYYPPPKRKKKHSSNNKYNNNTQKQKTKEKGIFLPPQSAEIPQVERRNKAQRGTLDLFIWFDFSLVYFLDLQNLGAWRKTKNKKKKKPQLRKRVKWSEESLNQSKQPTIVPTSKTQTMNLFLPSFLPSFLRVQK